MKKDDFGGNSYIYSIFEGYTNSGFGDLQLSNIKVKIHMYRMSTLNFFISVSDYTYKINFDGLTALFELLIDLHLRSHF